MYAGPLFSETALHRRAPAWTIGRAPAWTITAALAVVYLILAPHSADLAAATYRSDLFGKVGFTLWDNGWYAGHHLPAYSLFAPALGWLIGPALLAALSMTLAAVLFAALIDGHFPARATRIAAVWFALGAGVSLLSSRVPFDLGLAIGLAALLAGQRGRRVLAVTLAVCCSLASPVAGAFLALATLAWTIGGHFSAGGPRTVGGPFLARVDARRGPGASAHSRWLPALMTLAALAPIAALELLFPEGGSQPFVPSAFYPGLLGLLIIAVLIDPEQRVLKIGTLLYIGAYVAAYLLPTAVGANVDRLGALLAGPVAACVLAGRSRRRRIILLVLAPFLLYWQVNAPLSDFASAISNPAAQASYYTPLLAELRALDIGYSARPARIEVVPTSDHWEAVWVAEHVAIARGWERQLDSYRNGLFYDESTPLTPTAYHDWLSEQAIAYVALPDAPLDYSGTTEARLLQRAFAPRPAAQGSTSPPAARSYLREAWRSAHWRLFAVLDARPLAESPAVLTQLQSDSFTVRVPRPGRYLVRVHFTPYWTVSDGHGCVGEAPGGWTRLQADRAGSLHVSIDFSLRRVLGGGARCR